MDSIYICSGLDMLSTDNFQAIIPPPSCKKKKKIPFEIQANMLYHFPICTHVIYQSPHPSPIPFYASVSASPSSSLPQ